MHCKPYQVASAANDDLRRAHLLPGMASMLATSPIALADHGACRTALAANYAAADVAAYLHAAIAEAYLVRRRAA